MSEMISIIPAWFIPVTIVLVSIIALTIILERSWVLTAASKKTAKDEEKEFEKLAASNNTEDILGFCAVHRNPWYQVLSVIIKDNITNAADIETEKKNMLTSLEKYLPALGTIATIAPLLGLLGTVTGMIKSFRAFESTMNTAMMRGIDEALITTALGLIVAIPALIMYNYFVRKVNLLAEETDTKVDFYLRLLRNNEK